MQIIKVHWNEDLVQLVKSERHETNIVGLHDSLNSQGFHNHLLLQNVDTINMISNEKRSTKFMNVHKNLP